MNERGLKREQKIEEKTATIILFSRKDSFIHNGIIY